MSALRIFGLCLLTVLAMALLACDDNINVEGPPLPPQLNLTRFSEAGGLPDDSVYDIFTDMQGRTWFSTDLGMGMLENNNLTKFNQADGLIHPNCRSIHEFGGKIYIATWGGGVAVYDGAVWSHIDTQDGLVDKKVFNIASDDTSLWFSTPSGATQYDPVTGNFIKFIEKSPPGQWTVNRKGIFVNTVTSAVSVGSNSGNSEIWFGSKYTGITVWRPLTGSAVYFDMDNTAMPGLDINDIYYNEKDGKFWIAFSNKGLSSVDLQSSTWTNYNMVDGLPSEVIHAVTADSAGTIWVATNNGIAVQSGGGFKGYTTANGLPGSRVKNVYVDSENHVWAAFFDAGAVRLN